MESLNQKLLKVLITNNIIELSNDDPYRIIEILQEIDPDAILLTVFFEKEYSIEDLFKLFKTSNNILSRNENIEIETTEECFNNMTKQDLYELKKDALTFMLNSLGTSIRFKYAILKNLNEESIDRFFEQIYNVFTTRYAYLFIWYL